MSSLATVRNQILRRLGDTDLKVWTAAEIESYVKEGYNELAIRTRCFWDYAFMEDLAYTANYNQSWEKSYLTIAYDQFTRTESWEDAYINDGLIPGNHTAAWERPYLTKNYVSALSELPDNLYEIERAVWDNQRIIPLTTSEIEAADSRYETTEGDVIGYTMGKDGLRKLRKYHKPSEVSDSYTVTGNWGLLRSPGDLSSDTPVGTWGVMRRISGQQITGGPWGIPRATANESQNMKIEFFRRGNALTSAASELELPEVYVKYVQHFAQWKALERKGAGQDPDLAEHYRLRFETGVQRIRHRVEAVRKFRVGRMGGALSRGGPPPKPRLPWQYGKVVR